MIGLVFATTEEAQPFLNRVEARREIEEPFIAYSFNMPKYKTRGILIICGVGKVAAALATQFLLLKYRPTAVVNAGICGATQTSAEVGGVYQVSETREGDLAGEFAQIHQCDRASINWPDLPVERLITRDQPVYDEKLRRESAEWGLLVDMEGAAVVRTCHKHKTPCALLKGVTDFANSDGKDALKRNLKMVSKKLAEILTTQVCDLF